MDNLWEQPDHQLGWEEEVDYEALPRTIYVSHTTPIPGPTEGVR